jgi:parallel beta-helix repeat protein
MKSIHLFTLLWQRMRPALWRALLVVVGPLLLVTGLLLGIDQPTPPLYAQNLPDLKYSTTGALGKIITIGRAYSPINPAESAFVRDPSNPAAPKLTITLPQLLAWVQSKNYTPTLQALGNGVWQLDVTLLIEDNGRLDISTANGVNELRLISRPDTSYNIISKGGDINIDGVKVYSWDNSPGVNSYDDTYLVVTDTIQTRSYLAALNGGRMDIKNAEMMYLGYEELNSRVGYGKGEPSGLAWRLLPTGSTDFATGPKGSIIKSKVHHNYFGMYSYEAAGLVISATEVANNYFYGLDPHDDSHDFVVANNFIHDNGYTGLIFSRRCINNKVYGNKIYNNGSHGFMLDRGSNNNEIYNNEMVGNKYDGIAVYQSKNNTIYNNLVKDNHRYGVRISAEFDDADLFDDVAIDNEIRNNIVDGNGSDGIYVVNRADRNLILNNQVLHSGEAGVFLNAGLTILQGNLVSNSTLDGLIIDDEAYTTGTNLGGPAKTPVGAPGRDNQILGNRFVQNKQNGIDVTGGGNNRIGSLGAGNIISGNLNSGLLLGRTDTSVIDSNEIRNNTAPNGAGIAAKCNITAPVAYTIVNNVIVGNSTTDLKGRGAGIQIGSGCEPVINDNRIYNNRNNGVEANLQNSNVVGSTTINARNNIWGSIDPNQVETTIWHALDDNGLGVVDYMPLGNGPLEPPATPSPTPTPTRTLTPTPTLTPTGTRQATATPTGSATPTPTNTPTPTQVTNETLTVQSYLPVVER